MSIIHTLYKQNSTPNKYMFENLIYIGSNMVTVDMI